MKKVRTGGLFATAFAALLCIQPAAAETVVVTSRHMVDVQTGRIVNDPVIVITDGRITAVASKGARPAIPEGAKSIDLGEMTILPGLIDMHVHLASSPLYSAYHALQFTDSFWTAVGVPNAKDMLEAGFTTVRDLGSDAGGYPDVGLKQAVDEGLIPGPRIVPSGYLLGSTGGHCDKNLLPPSFHAIGEGIADSPDQFRQKVRGERKYGAEVIKVCATGGVNSRNTEPGQQQMTDEELQAVAKEAHMWGLRVAAHAHGAAGIKAAIRAGIDTIEHASMIDDEGIKLAKEHGTWLSMDIYNTEYIQEVGEKNGRLPENLRKDREMAAVQRPNLGKAYRAGVKMVFGSDAGVMPHGTAARQFATMVQFGMPPIAAIQSATRNAAEALGRERDVGTIQAGRYGDLIAVRGNPIEDIRLLEDVPFVMKGGEVVKDARQ